ncbi:MAG: aspartate aminotransferase family protein [Corynebacterium sp.]|nr:aspartate aminotransferase family protein [Corynebacterium sp.]
MPVPNSAAGKRAYELDRAHVFHSWSAQKALDPLVIEGGEGSYLIDADGNRYLDFSSQLVFTNIGHQHPKLVKAIQEQAGNLATLAPAHATSKRGEAAKKIVDHLPENLNKVLFTNGGADAVEHAIRLARLHTGRYKVFSQFRSYHGATHTTLNISGDNRRWPNDYGAGATSRFFGPFLYRSAYNATTEEEERDRSLAALENLIAFEGPDAFAALILESIPGTAGFMPPPAGFLEGVREICDKYGIVMILDEVMVGFGRTGTWFGFQNYDVKPDLVTFAKGVNSGYVPLGGVAISDEIAATFDERAYPGGLTYSGHPLATAAAAATIDIMEEEGTVEAAAKIGAEVFGPELAKLQEKHPSIGEVRGKGAFWALDLVVDRETKEPLSPYGAVNEKMAEVVKACVSRGLLIFFSMHRIHITPPLNISEEDARKGLAILDAALDVADSFYTGKK